MGSSRRRRASARTSRPDGRFAPPPGPSPTGEGPEDGADETSLWECGVRGANERFTRMWTGAQPRVAAYVRSLVCDVHAADDIMQDVAVTCMRKFGEFDPDRSFASWCMGIARIELLAYWRSARRFPLLQHAEVLEAVQVVHERLASELDERGELLGRCLRRVRKRTRSLLELCYCEGLQIAEAAERLGLRATSAKVMMARARAALRDCIEQILGGRRRDETV